MHKRDSKKTVRARWSAVAVASALILAVAACGGPGGGASVTVQLAPESVEVLLGASETVQVTITRSAAATAALSLQASGAPEWVTVEFSPAVLPGSSVESALPVATDSAHPDAEPTTFDVTVGAVGAGLAGQATLSVAVTLQDVAGTVVDAFGAPVAGATVIATGQ